jgi:hypothetical protein
VEQNSPARYVVPAGGAVVAAVVGAGAGAVVGAVVASVVGAVVVSVVATVVVVAAVVAVVPELLGFLLLEAQAPSATAPTHTKTRNGRSLSMPSLHYLWRDGIVTGSRSRSSV